MAEILERQPNYTCIQTIERSTQWTGSHTRMDDTLRLEVALVDGKELFAWPGSKQFEDHELRDLVSTGMIGNGSFAIHARTIFLTDSASFTERGETQLSGRPALRYDFQVSRSHSNYRLRLNDREAIVPFHGSFYADPVTLDVLRMEVITDDIPADLGISATETTVNYDRRRIGDEEFLLPVESGLMMAMPDVVNRNSVRLTSCRRFSGESTLTFDDPELNDTSTSASTEGSASAPAKEVDIPAGLPLRLEFSELDLMHAAIGDAVRATLRSDLKSGREVLAPKGSIAHGRIMRLDRYNTHFGLLIKFQDLDWRGGHARLKLRFEQTESLPGLITKAQTGPEILILRRAGPRLSGILMVWRMEQ